MYLLELSDALRIVRPLERASAPRRLESGVTASTGAPMIGRKRIVSADFAGEATATSSAPPEVSAASERWAVSRASAVSEDVLPPALLRASGNAFVASLVSGIGAAVTWTTIFKQRHEQLARDPVPDHVRVYEAVRARNPAAAQRAMTALLDLALLDTTDGRRPRKKRAGAKAKV